MSIWGKKKQNPSANNTFLLYSQRLGLDYKNPESYTETFFPKITISVQIIISIKELYLQFKTNYRQTDLVSL